MSFSPLFYWAAASLVIALVGLYVSRKTLKIDMERNLELIVAMLAILGTLVSVLLGLLVSSADEQYRAMEDCANSEATNISQIFGLSRGLPRPKALQIQNACIDYARKIVTEDWPAMKEGSQSLIVTQSYANLNDAIVSFRPADDGEAAIQGALISASSAVGQNRGSRIVTSRSTWTQRLLPLIITCAVVVLACSYLYAGNGTVLVHSFLVALVAVTLGINIGVIFLMTRPFSSQWAIRPLGFELALQGMERYKGSVFEPARHEPEKKAP
ncbi:MAG: DUF4239 domain-containing protein [Candidatus Obscuribacter sp.]|nr:DUF4239 domain-containing protein [Candidatus Obscuribacter sp.]